MRTRLPLIGALAVVTLALAGCTTTVSVPASEVETTTADALAPQLGFTPDVACPDDLAGEVGATLVCELTDEAGNTHDATITVTSVEGTDVDFDISVG